jgi:hypothetical protein
MKYRNKIINEILSLKFLGLSALLLLFIPTASTSMAYSQYQVQTQTDNQTSLITEQERKQSEEGQNQDQMRIGLQQPIIGYLTKAGGLYPMFNHIMFDSTSMQKLIFTLQSPPVIQEINNQTFKKLIDTAIDNNFFVMESPPPMYCSDCVNYILTLSIPFPSGTETNTVAFNSLYNFENPNDAKTMQTLLGLIENLEEYNYSQQQLPLY